MKKFSALNLNFNVVNHNNKRVVACDGVIVFTLEKYMESWDVITIREYLLERFTHSGITKEFINKFIDSIRKDHYSPNLINE